MLCVASFPIIISWKSSLLSVSMFCSISTIILSLSIRTLSSYLLLWIMLLWTFLWCLVFINNHVYLWVELSILSVCIIKFTRKCKVIFRSCSTNLKSHTQNLRIPIASHSTPVIIRALNFVHSVVYSYSSYLF